MVMKRSGKYTGKNGQLAMSRREKSYFVRRDGRKGR